MLKSLKILSLCLHLVSRVYSLWEWRKFEVCFYFVRIHGSKILELHFESVCNKGLNFLRQIKIQAGHTMFLLERLEDLDEKKAAESFTLKEIVVFIFMSFCTQEGDYYSYYYMVLFSLQSST